MTNAEDYNLKNFATLLQQLEGGALNDELGEKVREAVQEIHDACEANGGKKKARITLTLDIEKDAQDRFIELTAGVQSKHPKIPRGRAGVFFSDRDGNLTRQDPQQMTMDEVMQARQRKQGAESAD